MPLKSLEEYVLIFPKIAPKLHQKLDQFLLRLVIPNFEIGANAIITLATEKIYGQKLSLLFDIDASRDAIYADSLKEIWNDFEKLRVFKNEIFLIALLIMQRRFLNDFRFS